MNTTPVPSRLPGWLAILLLAAGLWLGLAGLFAAQFAVVGEQSWEDALRRSVGFWWPWAGLLPVVCALSFLMPFERPRRAWCLAVHGVAMLGVVMLCQALSRQGQAGQQGPERERPGRGVMQGPGPGPGGAGMFPPGPGGPGGPGVDAGMLPPGLRGPGNRRAGPPPAYRTMLDAVVYAGVFCLCQAVVYFRRAQERERRALALEGSLAQARLEALRLQLNPHFLFNSLNAVAGLVHTQPDTADDMIASVAELLRASLDPAAQQELPLHRELELLDLYLGIERVRFGDRFQCRVETQAGLDSALVPSLILQPLAENAVRHSLERRTGVVTLTVQVQRVGECLRITLTDRAESHAPASPGRSGHGIGVSNAARRLEALYGPNQKLTLDIQPDGCTATLELPWHTTPATPES